MKFAAVLLTAWCAASAASAAEPPPGASACSGCHPTASGVDTEVPRLIGMKAADIKTAMHDFSTGARPATVMTRIAKGYTEPEAAAIADWYAAQPN